MLNLLFSSLWRDSVFGLSHSSLGLRPGALAFAVLRTPGAHRLAPVAISELLIRRSSDPSLFLG
jgi:hypothetical protein